MKLLMSWTMAATLLFCATQVGARDATGANTVNKKTVSEPVMSLIPGIYVAGEDGEETSAFAVRISQVSGSEFKGTIELVRLAKSGELVRQTSELSGVLGKQREVNLPAFYMNTGVAPLTMKLQNGPLQSLMSGLEGNMSSTGFRLYWTLPRNTAGSSHGTFVLATENAFQQILARYSEISSYKKKLRAEQTSSANMMESRLNDYMQSTDQWLRAPQGNELDVIENKVRALYAEQKKLSPGVSADKAAAGVISIQIDAYASQAQYINWIQGEQERVQRGSWFFLKQMLEASACTDGTSFRLGYDVSPNCGGLPARSAAAEQRWNKVNQELIKQDRHGDLVSEALGCFKAAAQLPLEPNRGIPPSCEKFKLLAK